MIPQLTNHLWQSTWCALLAALLAAALRRNRAAVRYWLWFSASLKFFLPFSLLTGLASRLEWAPAAHTIAVHVATPTVTFAVDPVAQPLPSFPPTATIAFPLAFLAVWSCGCLAIVLIRLRGWMSVRAIVRASVPLNHPALAVPPNVRVRVSPGLAPGVVGWLHPVLLLPAGLTGRLTPPQLDAVLAHELCHVRRRDNLFALIHMLAEAVFWFHPLVWWIGAQLVAERERACDEEVLRAIGEPQAYAMGILNVCRFYTESPLAWVSGVTGANLKSRIEAIMTHRPGRKLNHAKKILLTIAAAVTLIVPILIGIGNAQPPAPTRQFDVATIKPNNSGADTSFNRIMPGGRLSAENAPLRALIASAYNVRFSQLSGGPSWLDSAHYDIEARGQLKPGIKVADQINLMLQTLLVDRFKLKTHRESKEMPIYALMVAKNGPKLEALRDTPCFDPIAGREPSFDDLASGRIRPCGGFSNVPGRMLGSRVTIAKFASTLSTTLSRTIVDKTGLTATYDIALKWLPDDSSAPPAPDAPASPISTDPGPSIFTALQEQLGLRLESQKGPVEILVIDQVEKSPTPN
jgi:bla regulator protein BlaR1